jgi:hypothetical protein
MFFLEHKNRKCQGLLTPDIQTRGIAAGSIIPQSRAGDLDLRPFFVKHHFNDSRPSGSTHHHTLPKHKKTKK